MNVISLKERIGSRVQGLQGQPSVDNPDIGIVESAVGVDNPNVGVVESAVEIIKQSTGIIESGITTPTAPEPNTTIPIVAESNTITPAVTEPSTTVPTAQEPSPEPDYTNFGIMPNPPAIESNYIAFTTNAIAIINKNLKNQPLSYQIFDMIKAPTGGTTVFTVPGISGEEIQKELIGIILDYNTPRAYWETPEPVEGTPPVCYSRNSIVSHEGKVCNTCVYNTFGSKDGDSKAKACKEFIEAYLLRPDNLMPVIVRIPVTSKHIFQKYLTRLTSSMIPLCGVVTKITLEKATSNGGQPYAKFIFEAVETLKPEEAEYARINGQKFSDMVNLAYEQDLKGVL
jgi:hypothetical protein